MKTFALAAAALLVPVAYYHSWHVWQYSYIGVTLWAYNRLLAWLSIRALPSIGLSGECLAQALGRDAETVQKVSSWLSKTVESAPHRTTPIIRVDLNDGLGYYKQNGEKISRPNRSIGDDQDGR